MQIFIFKKESDNKWYIEIPEWDGDKADLEMVMGADVMLDIFAQGEDQVELSLAQDKPETSCDTLTLIETCSSLTGGAVYQIETIENIQYDFTIWLCDVTLTIFDHFPHKLYIQKWA